MTTEKEKALFMCKVYEPSFDTADATYRIVAKLHARIAIGAVLGCLKYEAKADKKLISFYEKVMKEIEALPMHPEKYTEEQKLEMLYQEQQQREEEYFYNQENY